MAKPIYIFGAGQADGDATQKELLGGKGAGLAEMTRLGIPVPAGFTITTEVCNAFYASGESLTEEVRAAVREALVGVGRTMDARFGDPAAPLLVSVRSGARASMPGMMDTILNLGLNDAIVEGLARKTDNPRFALDAYRRFIVTYADVVLGVTRESFDAPLEAARREAAKRLGVEASRLNTEELQRRVPDSALDAEGLALLVQKQKDIVKQKAGAPFPDDPLEQLWGAITAVFRSWHNHRAKVYRGMHDIPESWGTACSVQAMVFGNLGDDSGTGVAFTRDPSTGERRFFGEWLPNAQGEDVVAGVRTPYPISAAGDPTSLEAKMPAVYAELTKTYAALEKHFRDMQDLEFTIQAGKLFLLQCRTGKRTARAAVRIAVEMVKEGLIDEREAVLRVDPASVDQLLHPSLDPAAAKRLLARGLPASPGAASGQVVFTADDAERRAGQGKAVILVRVETSPEDIHGMKAARGILTARGGLTSHAAVVARGMGKCCVAGCSSVSVSYEQQTMTISGVSASGGGTETVIVKAGDVITLDGATGSVYLGAVATVPAALTSEFDELMRWADKVRVLKVRANADTPLDARTARNFGAEGVGLCRTEHMFFDDERIAAVREMILAGDVTARRRAIAKLLPFQRTDFEGVFREMAGLPVTIRLLDPPLHEFLPHERAQLEELAKTMGVPVRELERKNAELHEFNPMLGHRGCRLAITFPEIYEMQARAILEAACDVAAAGGGVRPEIMIPLSMTRRELEITQAIVSGVAKQVFAEKGRVVDYTFGTMIELPRAAIMAGELAQTSDFFSFGTNDLTQTTMGLSRDDAGKFLPAYIDAGIFAKDPFQTIDVAGVGALVEMAMARGRKVKPGLKLGVCGEHGGDPASIQFFGRIGLDYVSCSPFRVPIARLAAAHAALRTEKSGPGATD